MTIQEQQWVAGWTVAARAVGNSADNAGAPAIVSAEAAVAECRFGLGWTEIGRGGTDAVLSAIGEAL